MEEDKKSLVGKVSKGLKIFKNDMLYDIRAVKILFCPWKYFPEGNFWDRKIEIDGGTSERGYIMRISQYRVGVR